MKRWALRICAFLLLGAIVNVAVALIGSTTIDTPRLRRLKMFDSTNWPDADVKALWQRRAADGWPELPLSQNDWSGPLASGTCLSFVTGGGSWWVPDDATDAELRDVYRGSGSFEVERIDCGFPFGSLRLERWKGDPMRSDLFPKSAGHDGWSFGDVAIPRHVLVLRTAINTVFYAVILWLLFALGGTPFALRRRRRIRRGLCPKCAYDLRGRGSDGGVCPECGTPQALPRKVETSTSPNVQSIRSTIEP